MNFSGEISEIQTLVANIITHHYIIKNYYLQRKQSFSVFTFTVLVYYEIILGGISQSQTLVNKLLVSTAATGNLEIIFQQKTFCTPTYTVQSVKQIKLRNFQPCY